MKSRVLVLITTVVVAVVLVVAWWVAAPVGVDEGVPARPFEPTAAVAKPESIPRVTPVESPPAVTPVEAEQKEPPPAAPDGFRLVRVRDLWDTSPVPGLAYTLGSESAPRAADASGWITVPVDAPIAQLRAASDSWWLADAADTAWFDGEEVVWAGRIVTVVGELVPAEGGEFSAQELEHAQVGLVMTGHPELTVVADGARTTHWWRERLRSSASDFDETYEVGNDGTFRFRALVGPEWSIGNREVPGRRREIAPVPRPGGGEAEVRVQLRLRPTRAFKIVVRDSDGELADGARVVVHSSLRVPTPQSGSVRAARLGGGYGSTAGAHEAVFRYMSSAVGNADGVAVAPVEHDHPARISVELEEHRVCTIEIEAGSGDVEREVQLQPTHDTPDVRLFLDGEPVRELPIAAMHADGSTAGLPTLRTDAYGYLDTGHFDEGARYQLRYFMRPDIELLEFRWSGQEELHFRQKERSRPERRPR